MRRRKSSRPYCRCLRACDSRGLAWSKAPDGFICQFSNFVLALDLLIALGNNRRCRMPAKNSISQTKRLSRREARHLDVKITFMEGIVRRDPHYVEALQILGDHYTERGKFDHSLKVDQQLSRL